MGKNDSTQKQLQAARERERNAPKARLQAKHNSSPPAAPVLVVVVPKMVLEEVMPSAFTLSMMSGEVEPEPEADTPTEQEAVPEEEPEPPAPAPIAAKVGCRKCSQSLKARDYAAKRAGVRLKS